MSNEDGDVAGLQGFVVLNFTTVVLGGIYRVISQDNLKIPSFVAKSRFLQNY